MAITESTKYNQDFLEVAGVFSGSVETDYAVKVNDSEKWAWRSKAHDSSTGWTAWSSYEDIVANDVEALSNSITIKFTRADTADYNDGDYWSFTAYVDLVVAGEDDTYDSMTILEKEDESDLVLISKKSGTVTVISNFDGDSPAVSEEVANIGSTDTIDYERNNKEIYIATGKKNGPRWLGYVNSSTFNGPSETPEVYSCNAFDLVGGGEPPNEDVFDIGCVIKGDDVISNEAELLVGINVDGERADKFLHVYNRDVNKVFKFATNNVPIMIKKWYKLNEDAGEVDQRCTGVAVLTRPASPEFCAELQLWSVPESGATVGQDTNLVKTLKIKAPVGVGGGTIDFIKDFQIMPSHSDLSSGSLTWTLFIAANKEGRSEYRTSDASNYQWIWKNTDFDSKGDGGIVDGWINVTPKMTFADEAWEWNTGAEKAGSWWWMARQTGAGAYANKITAISADAFNWSGQYVHDFPTYHLIEAGGYDDDGENPTVMWTCKLRPMELTGQIGLNALKSKALTTAENTAQTTAGTWYSNLVGPFINDDYTANKSQRTFRAANWVCYNIPVDATGSNQYPILLHQDDWNHGMEPQDRFMQNHNVVIPDWLFTQYGSATGRRVNLKSCPSRHPNFGVKGRFHIYGQRYPTSANGVRMGMHYYRPGNHTHYCIKASYDANDAKHHWTEIDRPHIFPNTGGATVFSNWSSGDQAWGTTAEDSVKFNKLPYDTLIGSDDKYRWRLAEGPMLYNLMVISGPPVEYASFPSNIAGVKERAFIMGVPYGKATNKQLCVAHMNLPYSSYTDTAAITSEFSASTAFLNLETPVDGGDEWAGASDIKKVFYKITFIYDGYQETVPLSKTAVWSSGTALNYNLKFEIRVDDSFEISKRISSFAVYRAYSQTQSDTKPEGHYRFLEEVDLLSFNHSAANSRWEYTVYDDGDVEGSYEAINGISENMHSLNIRYTCNAQQNGFHFVGNVSHSQFPDAENYIFRSQAGKFSIFDWSRDFIVLPFVPVAMKGFVGKLYAFGKNQIAVINPESMFIEDVIDGVGCIGPKSVMVAENGMFWVDHRNAYLAAPSFRTVADNIVDIETNGWMNLTNAIRDKAVLAYDSKRKSFLIFYQNAALENRCWAYTAPDKRWDLWEVSGEVKDSVQSRDGSAVLLLNNSTVCKYLSGPNRRDWSWESKKMTFQQDMVDKKIRNLKLEASSRASTALYYKVDGSSAWTAGTDVSTKFTGSNNRALTLTVADKGKQHWVKMKATGNNDTAGSNIKAYAMSAIYKPKRPK